VVEKWRVRVDDIDVDVDVRIPGSGPSLLMNRVSMEKAFESILNVLASCVREGDRIMIECSTTADKAIVCVADTGQGLPGNLLSRLFMPFSDVDTGDEYTSAMSLAGDIVHRHSGEIMVKSSPSWKTILLVTFPLAANRDRRRSGTDRRGRRRDRREPVESR
jgi:signal transduction histidine kinase